VWVPAVGTRRRLQALTAAGWSSSQLAERLGVTKSAIAQLRRVGQDRVLATTAGDVAALYDRCWWRTPPGRYQARAERYAAAQGWRPPWDWDGVDLDDPAAAPLEHGAVADVDQVAIEETIAGRRVPLTRAERRCVVDELHRRGVSAGDIAQRVGLSARTIVRYTSAGHRGPLQDVA
jgi:transposase